MAASLEVVVDCMAPLSVGSALPSVVRALDVASVSVPTQDYLHDGVPQPSGDGDARLQRHRGLDEAARGARHGAPTARRSPSTAGSCGRPSPATQGYEVDYEGDAFFYAFDSAQEAVSAVSEAMAGSGGGPDLDPRRHPHGHARARSAQVRGHGRAHGGADHELRATAARSSSRTTTAALVDVALCELGEHRLKDIEQAGAALPARARASFPPLKTISNTNLPTPASSFLGRDDELAEVLSRLEDGARLRHAHRARRHRQDAARHRGGRHARSRVQGRCLLGRASPRCAIPRSSPRRSRRRSARRTASPSTSQSARCSCCSTTSSR